MKRALVAALTWVMLLAGLPAAGAAEGRTAPGTSAGGAILMDAGSGRVLYESNAHEPRLIASITKLMTALVALESGHDLDETVVIDPEWAGAEGSSIYLRAGEQVSLETLLYGMLLRSGNDAALAVAGFCGGTVERFVERMNQKADALGMEDTSFANPNGLNDDAHYSSAYDMALLARACLEEPTLADMVATRSITLEGRTFTNHNKLLWQYEGCIGLKTGYTEKAGRTLVSAARRDGLTLICVTLSDPNDWADHAALFDYGFDCYRAEVPLRSGAVVGYLPVTGSLVPRCPVVVEEEVPVALAQGEKVTVTCERKEEGLEAPVSAGRQVGTAVLTVKGEELARIPLVTGADVACDKTGQETLLDRILGRLSQLSP